MKTDAFNYILTIILFIIDKNNKVYLVAFLSQTFTFIELNFNTYDKKFLVIFKAFRI